MANTHNMLKIGLIGSGNLAWHLAKMFNPLGYLEAIFVRSAEKKSDFGFLPQQVFVHDLADLIWRCDMLFFAVPDNQIPVIINSFHWQNKYLIHSAGSVALNIFKESTDNYGVFYPLQTFSKNRHFDYAQIPIFVEANSPQNEHVLINLASKISSKNMILDSERRKEMHLAAVFVNNFANHMWSIGQELCIQNNIPFDYLQPLLQETYLKAMENSAISSQTGPAVRHDAQTMKMHLEMLKNKSLLKKIYSFVSESIIQTQKTHEQF